VKVPARYTPPPLFAVLLLMVPPFIVKGLL
jgi:hypothetical protein